MPGQRTAATQGKAQAQAEGVASEFRILEASQIDLISITGWWFGTLFFPSIGNVIIPFDELIFFAVQSTNQLR
jgi:hypothetical protein